MTRGKKEEKELTIEERLEQALVPVEEQPYELPPNWCWVKLAGLKASESGFFDGDWVLSENMDIDGDVRLLQLSDIGDGEFLDKSNKHISSNTFNLLNCTELFEGDIMISRMAEPIARSCIVPLFPYRVITAVDVAVIRCKKELILNTYLNYVCNSNWFTELAMHMARGTTRVRITRSNLGKMPVPLPSLAEQQRIVDRIESLFAKLDEAKEKAQAVVDGFETRKAAILHKAFTGKLTRRWRIEYDASDDETWEIKLLGEITSNYDSKRIPLSQEERNGLTHLYDYYGASGIIDQVDRYIFEGRYLLIGEDGANLVIRSKPIAFIADGRFWVNNHAHVLKASGEVSLDYLCYYINSIDLTPYITGSAQPKMTQVKMNGIPIPVPTISEQVEIVCILDNLLDKEQQVKKSAVTVLDQIETMKKSILARALRGELGTNDPTEENAVELLKKVL